MSRPLIHATADALRDTGWRDITGLIIVPPETGAWSAGTLSVKRTGPIVDVALSPAWIGGNGETILVSKRYELWEPTLGFRRSRPSPGAIRRGQAMVVPLTNAQTGLPNGAAALAYPYDTGDPRFRSIRFWSGSATLKDHCGVMSFTTDDPWPLILPGIPA